MRRIQLLLSSFLLVFLAGCSPSEEEASENVEPEEPTEIVEEVEPDPEPEVEEDPRTEVSFFAVGDNLIHSQIIDYAATEDGGFDFKPIYTNFADDIKYTDLAFINQESIIGGDDLLLTGYPSFNTPSDMVENLVDLGFDIVVGSNNHSLDRGSAGIKNTLAYWREFEDDILFTGVFESQEHRDEIPLIEMNGITFSILTYTYATNGLIPDAPYQVNYFDPDVITNDIARAKEVSDFVIVAAHMGEEHDFFPNQMQLDYAQFFADLEVDLVMGAHPHAIQPLEWVTGENGNETLIIYSLGNFLASSLSDINLLGGSLRLDFVEEAEDYFIENVRFVPHLVHYEEAVAGDISTRTDFEIFKLDEYTDELADQHALDGYEDNIISVEHFQNMVDEVIPEVFLEN